MARIYGFENLLQNRVRTRILGNHERTWNKSDPLANVMYLGGFALIVSLTTFSANTSVGIALEDFAISSLLRIWGIYDGYSVSSVIWKKALALSDMFDLINPGATVVTWMPSGLHSIQRVSMIMWVAVLVAEYRPPHGVGLCGNGFSRLIMIGRFKLVKLVTYNIAAIDPMVTMVPLSRLAIWGATALDTLSTEKVLSSNALRAWSMVMSSIGPELHHKYLHQYQGVYISTRQVHRNRHCWPKYRFFPPGLWWSSRPHSPDRLQARLALAYESVDDWN